MPKYGPTWGFRVWIFVPKSLDLFQAAEVENARGVRWGMDVTVPEGALSQGPSDPPGSS